MKEDRIPTDGATWTLIWGRVFYGLSCYMFVTGALVALIMLAVHAWAIEYEAEQAQFIDVPAWLEDTTLKNLRLWRSDWQWICSWIR